ncbi:hypothetical protein E4U15_001350 [Claviceps sp. LM218 group G6]|nr:hypothetical protein E4U15_001350 [Claviceps sp. LM218 group G6]KAG6105794.1 hypothetical protein E4U14_004934 [Claviceps sp. LM454 group G7]
MKFTKLTLIFTSVSGANSLVIFRGGSRSPVFNVLKGVQSAIDDLDTAVNDWTVDPATTFEASNKLIGTINNGTETLRGCAELNFLEALELLAPVDTLNTHAQNLVDDLKAKKKQIEGQGLCDIVRGQINDMDSGSKDLVETTVSKIPVLLQGIGRAASRPVVESIESAKEDFSPTNCVNAAA